MVSFPGMKKTFKADQAAGLQEFLLAALPEIKKTKVKQFLKYRCVSVNDCVTTRFDHPIKPGDEVRIETSKERALTPAAQFNLEIVYEDEEIIVINKPAGLLTIATEKIQRETAIFAVNDYLNKKAAARYRRRAEYRKRVFVVHRLDRDVSGLVLFAKNEAAKFKLQENWEGFLKEYDAVVEGRPEKESGRMTSWLTENKFLKVFSGPKTAESKMAVTHYEVVKPGKEFSLLKVRLETGRKHQIRVQLSDLGHPVAGDKTYGARSALHGRVALHASRLEFNHPTTGKRLTLTSGLPPELKRLLKNYLE